MCKCELCHARFCEPDILHLSDQHNEMSDARQYRDQDDLDDVLIFLQRRNPFIPERKQLLNIITGIEEDGKTNIHEAKAVGEKILELMTNSDVNSFSFKCKMQAVRMGSKFITKDKVAVIVDPQCLFQRLVAVLLTSEAESLTLEFVLNFELCPFPPALLESPLMLRGADKPQLSKALKIYTVDIADGLHEPCMSYVLDGGALLHKITWVRKETFAQICSHHVNYVKHQYGTAASIIFDSYPDTPTTKDIAHLRRS